MSGEAILDGSPDRTDRVSAIGGARCTGGTRERRKLVEKRRQRSGIRAQRSLVALECGTLALSSANPVKEFPTFQECVDVRQGASSHRDPAFHRRAAEMRQQDHVVASEETGMDGGLAFVHIQSGARQQASHRALATSASSSIMSPRLVSIRKA